MQLNNGPGASPTVITTFPWRKPTSTAVAIVSRDVFGFVMISSNCILSTGEK